MGLKTTNYVSKKLGITLPSAYALVTELKMSGGYGTAEFSIQTSRDAAINLPAIEKVKIDFAVDRNESLMKTAYKKATEKYISKHIDPVTGEEVTIETGMFFKDWTDDLVDTTAVKEVL